MKGILKRYFAQVWLKTIKMRKKSNGTDRMAQGCCVLLRSELCGLVTFCGYHHAHRLSSILKKIAQSL